MEELVPIATEANEEAEELGPMAILADQEDEELVIPRADVYNNLPRPVVRKGPFPLENGVHIVLGVDEDDVLFCEECWELLRNYDETDCSVPPPYCFEIKGDDPSPDTSGNKAPRFVCLHLIWWVGTDKATAA